MTKYGIALQHAKPSLLGFSRLLAKNPGFAVELFRHRLHYFRTRNLKCSFLTPEKCLIETPDMLVSYWSMFIENELLDRRWTTALKEAAKPVVVDVGANAGIFTLFAHSINPQSEIIAFEPLPGLQTKLQDTKSRTGMRLTVHQKALSDRIGIAHLESPHGYDGTSRLSKDGEVPLPTAVEVEATTLDHVLVGHDILLMKVDVEGFECEVLAGGRETLKRIQFMIIEAQTAEHAEKVIRAAGPGWKNERLGRADIFFYR